jgi:hypothetical protein
MANETAIDTFTNASNPTAATGTRGLDAFLNMGEFAPAPISRELPETPQEESTAPTRAPLSSYDEAFQRAESQYGLPNGLLSTMGYQESRFNPNAVNQKSGATGILQFIPSTAKEYKIDPRDPYASINAAGQKMAGLVKYYNGDVAKAVAAYNYGEGNLNRAIKAAGDNWISAIPEETQGYLSNVLGGRSAQLQGQAQAPQVETYDIPLLNGKTLKVPTSISREDALAEAKANGIDAIGLRELPLANGSKLRIPDDITDEDALAEAKGLHPDLDFTTQAEATHQEKMGFIPSAKSAALIGGSTFLRGGAEMLQGAGQSMGFPSLEQIGTSGIEKSKEWEKKAGEISEAPTETDPLYRKIPHYAGEFVGGIGPYAAGLAIAPEVVAPSLLAGTMGSQALGSMAQRTDEQGKDFEVMPHLPAAAAETAVNYVTLGVLGPLKGKIQSRFMEELLTPNVQKYIADVVETKGVEAAKTAVGSKVADIAKEFGLNTAGMAFGDVGSAVIERAATGQDISSSEAMDEYWENLKTDLVGGGLLAGPMGLSRHAGKQGALEQAQRDAEAPAVAPQPIQPEVNEQGYTQDIQTKLNEAKLAEEAIAAQAAKDAQTAATTDQVPPAVAPPEQIPTPEQVPPAVGEGIAPTPPEAEPIVEPEAGPIAEPTVRKPEEPIAPEAPHWADALGLTPSSAKYKQLKQLDINDTDHHSAIKNILDSAAKTNMKIDPIAVEGLYKQLDAISPYETSKKKLDFGETLGYDTKPLVDREGRLTLKLKGVENEPLRNAVHSSDMGQTIDALSQSKNPIIRHLAEASKNLTGLTIKSGVMPGKKKNAGGAYEPAAHLITMNPKYAGNEAIVGHELLHANVYHAIENPAPKQKPAVAGLTKLHATVKNHPTLAKEYGLKDVHEFVSEGLTNPEFQYKLKKIKYENTTMWGKFTQSIADMLGLKRDNAFVELLTHTENLLPSEPVQRKNISPSSGGTLFSFAGKMAATADKTKQEEAFKRTLIGQNAEKVRQDTGWHKGADDKWRFEISDKEAKFTKNAFKESMLNRLRDGIVDKKPKTVSDVLDHPKLFEAYPSAKNITAHLTMDKSKPESGSFNHVTNEISINRWSKEQVLSTLLHEIQHHIQNVEDFAAGSNSFASLTKKENDELIAVTEKKHKLEKELIKSFPDPLDGPLARATQKYKEIQRLGTHISQLMELGYNRYVNSHGEAEARNTQTRQSLSDKERKSTPPTSTLDVFQSSYDIRRKGESFDADKISKATTPNVSRSTQPEVRQEGKGAPISSEGVREGRPETGQVEKEKVTHGTPEFKKWFGSSKVKNNKGEPLIVYHGSDKEFTTFDLNAEKKNRTSNPRGIYTTPNKTEAKTYGKNVIGLYAKSENPYVEGKSAINDKMAAKYAQVLKDNYPNYGDDWVDNVIVPEFKKSGKFKDIDGGLKTDVMEAGGYDSYKDGEHIVLFNPNQIKSATGNTGAFSTENPDIRYSEVAPDEPGLGRLRSADILVDRSPKGEELKKQRDKDIEKAQMAVNDQSTLGRTLNKIRSRFIAHDSALDYATREDKTFQANGEFHERILRNQAKERRNFISSAIEHGIVTRSSTGLLTINRSEALNLVNILDRAHDLPKGFKAEDVERILTVLANEGHQIRYQDIERRAVQRRADAAKLVTFAKTFPKGSLERKSSLATAQEIRKLANSDQRRVDAIKEKGGIGQHITSEMVADAHSVMNSVPEIKAIVDDVHKVMQSLVDLLESTGNIDASVAREWRNPKYQYAPLYMSTDELESIGESNIHISSAVKGIGKVKAKGVSEHRINMFENLQKHYAFAVDAAMENNYKSASLNWLAAHGSARELASNKGSQFQQVVSILRNGKSVMFAIDDPVLFDAFKDIARLELPAFITAPSMVVRKGALVNPMFWYRQLIRDPFMANFTAQTGLVTPFGAARSFLSILTNHNAEYKELVNKGVLQSQSNLADQKLDFIKGKKQRSNIQKGWSFAQHVHEAADAATRVEVYKAALKEAKKQKGLTKEQQNDFAVSRARDFMSFANQGSDASVRMINQSVPFFNSFLNGMDVLLRSATGMNMSKADAARARKLFRNRAMFMTAASMAYAYTLSSNSQDYRDAKPDDWMNNWLMPGLGDKRMGKAASPFEIGIAFKLIPEAMVRQLMGLDTGTRSNELLFNAVLNGLTPPLPIPAFAKPILEAVTGKSMFGKNPAEWFDIESPGAKNLVRAERGRGKSYIADAFSDLTGMSPAISQTLLKGYGTEVYNVADMIANGLSRGIGEGLGKDWTETVPYAKAFVTNPNALGDQNEVYSQAEKYKQISNTMTHLLRVGDPRAALYATDENMPALYGSKAEAKILGAMTKLNQAMAYTENDTSMPIEEKRKQMEELLAMKRTILDMGMGVIKKVEED